MREVDEVKVKRTELRTNYLDSQGELQIAVRQRSDTKMWVVFDWTGPTNKHEEFDTRDAAEASAKKLAREIR